MVFPRRVVCRRRRSGGAKCHHVNGGLTESFVKYAFPYLGKRRTTSRKGAFWAVTLPTPDRRLTERRSLQPAGVGQSASFREVRLRTEICGPWHNPPRRLAGGLLERICPVGPFSIVPRSLAGGLPHTSGAPRRDGKTHSASHAVRQSAFCVDTLTEKHTLPRHPTHSGPPPYQKTCSARRHATHQATGHSAPLLSSSCLSPQHGLSCIERTEEARQDVRCSMDAPAREY